MRLVVSFIFLVLSSFPFGEGRAAPTDCSILTGPEHVQCRLVDVMDNQVADILKKQVCGESYCNHDSSTPYYNTFKGMFYKTAEGGTDINTDINTLLIGNRNQQAAYTLAFLFQNKYSDYENDTTVLATLNRALVHLRRAQSDYGKITDGGNRPCVDENGDGKFDNSDCGGWCGVDYADVDHDGDTTERNTIHSVCEASPAIGFGYYGIAQAINVLLETNNSEFIGTLNDLVDANGDGKDDNSRKEVYACMLLRGAQFLQDTTGNGKDGGGNSCADDNGDNCDGDSGGRGHAPNQDTEVLLALTAMKKAYKYLADHIGDMNAVSACNGDLVNPPLISEETLDALKSEIFDGKPAEAAEHNAYSQWFSDQGMILESGYRPEGTSESASKSVGYDASYGNVTLRALVMLNKLDPDDYPIASGIIQDYVEGARLMVYPDIRMEQGGFHIDVFARRRKNNSDPEMPFLPAGIGQQNETLRVLFNTTLDHFLVNPPSVFSDLDPLGGQLYTIGDLVRYWTNPVYSSYLLPLSDIALLANRAGTDIYNDSQANLKVIVGASGTLEDVHYDIPNWWNGVKHYYWGESTARITGATAMSCTPDGTIPPCKSTYDDGGRYQSGEPDTARISCYSDKDKLKEVFICYQNKENGNYIVEVQWSCKIDGNTINISSCHRSSDLVDGNGNGIGNYFDDSDADGTSDYFDGDDDNDGVSDSSDCAPYDPSIYQNCKEVDSPDPTPHANVDVTSILSLLLEGDEDNDSYYDDDCNDDNPSIYPGAPEVCGDTTDQDCSGADLSCNDVDNDSDGYTETQGDCRDDLPAVSPAATESCDGIDNNCDGKIDSDCDDDGDGLTNAKEEEIGTDPKKSDTDGDGLSDGMEVKMGTYPRVPTDLVTPMLSLLLAGDEDDDTHYATDDGGDDCDDDDPTVYPGAAEICGDEVDEDCNGSDLSCPNDPDDIDNDEDGYTENQGDCDDTNWEVNPGMEEVDGDGIDNDCDGTVDENTSCIGSETQADVENQVRTVLQKSPLVSPKLSNAILALVRRHYTLGSPEGLTVLGDDWADALEGPGQAPVADLLRDTSAWLEEIPSPELVKLTRFLSQQADKNPSLSDFLKHLEKYLNGNTRTQGIYLFDNKLN